MRRRGAVVDLGKISDMVLVYQRPAELKTRLIARKYGGDLIMIPQRQLNLPETTIKMPHS